MCPSRLNLLFFVMDNICGKHSIFQGEGCYALNAEVSNKIEKAAFLENFIIKITENSFFFKGHLFHDMSKNLLQS